MIATLCWKEYREQRGVWLAIVVLAVLLVVGIGSMAEHGLWHIQQDVQIRSALAFLMASLAAGHGVVCGAQLLAGEKETGTLAFLDMSTARREPIWQTKAVMGCLLTLAQSQILAGLAVFFNLTSWSAQQSTTVTASSSSLLAVFYDPTSWSALSLFPVYALLSVFGLCWGLAGGSLCRFVLPAISTGAVLLLAGLMLTVNVLPEVWLVTLLSMGGVAAAWSRYAFCRSEKKGNHRPEPRRRRLPMPRLEGTGAKSCLWLAMRQGRWTLRLSLAGCLWAGLFITESNLAVRFPLDSLMVGLLCGLMVFAPEQVGAQERFLSAQRMSPGWLWLSKNLLWMGAGVLMLGTLSLPVFAQDWQHLRGPEKTTGILYHAWMYRPVLLFVVWPIYGFCFGQFFTLLTKRLIVAVVMAAFACVVVLAAWLPSLLFGGLGTWQILAIPLLLLVATRLSMWNWLTARMFAGKHILALAGCALFALLWLAGNFWYRAVEFSDVGEPFDLAEYDVELDRAARSEAGAMIRRAAGEEAVHRKKVDAKLGRPCRLLFPAEPGALSSSDLPKDFQALSFYITENGWPTDDAEIGRWLDAMFADPWADNMRAAAKMPLGMIVDPRRALPVDLDDLPNAVSTELSNCQNCAVLFSVRALQLKTRGDPDGALKHLDVALALSRQVRDHAAVGGQFWIGLHIEETALNCFAHWLAAVGPDAGRIRRGLDLLLRHEAEAPGPMDSFKAQYVAMMTHLTEFHRIKFAKAAHPLEQRLFHLAVETPWERERTVRLLNLMARLELKDRKPQEHFRRYSELYYEHQLVWSRPSLDLKGFDESQVWLHARQTVAALALYEVEKGKPADSLADLVPVYLAKVPIDPVTHKPFSYRVAVQQENMRASQPAGALGLLAAPNGRSPLLAASTLIATSGELIQGMFGGSKGLETKRLFLGQGMVWLERAPYPLYFLVPCWTK